MYDRKEKLDFIPSQTVREYARKIQHSFSDMDIATILYHALPCGERTPALRELAAQTEDAALRRQIEERLAYERLLRERFEDNDGSFFYAVAVCTGEEKITVGHYASSKAALAAGKDGGGPFCVSKYQLADLRRKLITAQRYFSPRRHAYVLAQPEPYLGQAVAEYCYDVDGTLQMYWSEETTPEEADRVEDGGAARFEDRFLFLPDPFERGDMVCVVDRPESVGVVETSREDWRTFLEQVRAKPRAVDFQDASITVEFLVKDGEFHHDHIPPIFLERVEPEEDDARTLLLKAAGRLLQGTGGLDELFRRREDYLAERRKDEAHADLCGQ